MTLSTPGRRASYLWTSEHVSPGHPDKIADQISDTVLDLHLAQDARAKVACETLVKNDSVIVAGEITSTAVIPPHAIEDAIRRTIRRIGYDERTPGFSADTCRITLDLHAQSPEINRAVDTESQTTAGDQGIMFGYATRETPERMPTAITLAKRIIDEAFTGKGIRYAFRPDMKSQVTLRIEDGRVHSVDAVVLSVCHDESLSLAGVREVFHDELLPRVLDALPGHLRALFTASTTYHINPAGAWHVGGPVADCG
ncbi:MAG: S-adenosylmethionine synthetase N-terminal domain-containing protein, partial [Candidatus Kapaibacterium sp.]